MSNQYNFYNLEASFKNWLIAEIDETQSNAIYDKNQHETTQKKLTKISVKNYLSDLRHFFGWLIFYLKSNKVGTIHELPLQRLITIKTISDYKTYLLENKIPLKTINRRLSTIRKFCSFCISQGWIKENPAKKVNNIANNSEMLKQVQHDILNLFRQDLQKENLDQNTIKSYLETVQEFLAL